jgi:hypothetical protein
MKQVLFSAASLVLLRRHRSSVVAHQHAVEFFFLSRAFIVTLGLGVLLLLVFVCDVGAALLLAACGCVTASLRNNRDLRPFP